MTAKYGTIPDTSSTEFDKLPGSEKNYSREEGSRNPLIANRISRAVGQLWVGANSHRVPPARLILLDKHSRHNMPSYAWIVPSVALEELFTVNFPPKPHYFNVKKNFAFRTHPII